MAHFFLLTDCLSPDPALGRWRFVLSNQTSGETISAGDAEPDCDSDRLALLALVRGLEAIDCPATVTLLTSSRYVRFGLERGLRTWKANDWKWERFGRLVTVRDQDLWIRVAQALEIHEVECRSWRLSVGAHAPDEPSNERPKADYPTQPAASFEPRSAALPPHSFHQEPALLVVRKPRNRLRLDQAHPMPKSSRKLQKAAC